MADVLTESDVNKSLPALRNILIHTLCAGGMTVDTMATGLARLTCEEFRIFNRERDVPPSRADLIESAASVVATIATRIAWLLASAGINRLYNLTVWESHEVDETGGVHVVCAAYYLPKSELASSTVEYE